MKPCLEVAVVRDPQIFAALEEEWDDLYHNCPRATPYQSWAWLYSWWEAYGEDYELRLITVHSGEGLLVGLIPLMLERRRWGFGKLLLIGARRESHYLDVLVRRDWEAEVYEVGVQALELVDGWHVAELHPIVPTATIWDFFKGWNGPRSDFQQTRPLWVIEVKPWDELVKSLTKNHRKIVRRTLRRAEEDGVRCVLAGVEDVERAARTFVALHREMRRGRHIIPEHLTARFESYTLATARRLMERGLGGISEFWRDGEVIVSTFLIFVKDLTVTYMVGANQEAFSRYQWSTLFIWDALNIARSRNCAYVSLLSGPQEYKQRWSNKEVPHYRIALVRSSLLGRFYLPAWRCYRAFRSLRLRIRDHLKSDTTPRWVKDAAKPLKLLKLLRRRTS
jgi:CelD/BcsL family acetyltransferase involved in cellulose biosynthesis